MQMSTDTKALGRFYRDILQERILRPNWMNNSQLYLHSYQTDSNNPYSVGGVVRSINYTGWNSPVGCVCVCVYVCVCVFFFFDFYVVLWLFDLMVLMCVM